jgi:hypothetical protein
VYFAVTACPIVADDVVSDRASGALPLQGNLEERLVPAARRFDSALRTTLSHAVLMPYFLANS